jgi:RNA polymerase sigma factor (sigma-70 family)
MDKIRNLVVKTTASDSSFAAKHEAFGEIVRLFQDMAYAYAYSVLGNFQLAEDAAQEAFITAWQKLEQLREPSAFPGWFRRIVLSECHRLTRSKRLQMVAFDAGAEISGIEKQPQEIIEQCELQNTVRAAVASLPPNERMAITLFYLDEQSHKAISEFLEVPETTVAKRLYSARQRLKNTLMSKFKDESKKHRPSRNKTFAEKVQAGIFDAYIGEYQFESRPELTVTIKKEGNALVSESAGQRNQLFAPGKSETELLTREFDGKGHFVKDKRGRVTHFVYYEFGKELGRALKIS